MLKLFFLVTVAFIAGGKAQDVIVDPILPPPVISPPILPPPLVPPSICPPSVLPPPVLPPPIIPPSICSPLILPPPPVCGVNEVYIPQGPAPNCERLCTEIGRPCNIFYRPPLLGCYCLPGYARDLNNICVPISQCSIRCVINPYAFPY